VQRLFIVEILIEIINQRRLGMKTGTKILIVLIILGIVDMVVPVPILGITLIYVVLQKPLWFRVVVEEIYRN
jgi:hypothetical protein